MCSVHVSVSRLYTCAAFHRQESTAGKIHFYCFFHKMFFTFKLEHGTFVIRFAQNFEFFDPF